MAFSAPAGRRAHPAPGPAVAPLRPSTDSNQSDTAEGNMVVTCLLYRERLLFLWFTKNSPGGSIPMIDRSDAAAEPANELRRNVLGLPSAMGMSLAFISPTIG